MNQSLQQLVDKLAGWLDAGVQLLPNLVVALIVVVLFALLARVARRSARRVSDTMKVNAQVGHLLGTVAYLAMLAAGVVIALTVLKLGSVAATFLAGAGVVGLALGFAFQDIASNFMAGILLSIRRPFGVGDLIETNGYLGVVQETNLRSTLIQTPQGQVVFIPNSEVFENPLVNYARRPSRRIDLACGVAYGDDLEQAKRVAVEAITSAGIHDTSQPVSFFYESFGGSSIDFGLYFWIPSNRQGDFLEARSKAIMVLKEAFDAAGITIPFPITTLDFGVVGGEKLDEVLPKKWYDS